MNTKTDVYDYIINNPDTYTIFKLGAPWCGPCKRVARPFKQLMTSDKYQNVKVIELNVDDQENDPESSLQEMMGELGLKKIPHFFISHNGEKIANIQTSNPNTLESFLDEYLTKTE